MVIVPAVGLGLLFVFFVGAALTFGILWCLKQLAKRNPQSRLHRSTLKRLGFGHLTENEEGTISVVGGVIAVVLVVILMIEVPREWTALIWYGLTVIGILVGISTFFLFGSRSESKAETRRRPADTQERHESGKRRPKHQPEGRGPMYERQRKRRESEQARQEHQAEYQARVYEIQRTQAEIQAVKDDLYSLFGRPGGESQKRERVLEGVFNRFFKASGILVTEPFEWAAQEGGSIAEHHMEGAIEIDGCSYLVEMTWREIPLGSQDVAPHLVRVFNRGYAGGVLVSSSGFNPSAISTCEEALPQRTAVLCELEEIVSLLERNGSLKDFLKAKIAAAVVHKNPLFRPPG